MTDADGHLEGLRADLQTLVRQLITENAEDTGQQPIAPAIKDHLGPGAAMFPIFSESFHPFDLPNLHLAVEDLLARPDWSARPIGVGGHHKRHSMLGLGELMSQRHWGIGPLEYINTEVGPGRTLPCFDFTVFLIDSPDAPIVMFLKVDPGHMGRPAINVQAVSPQPEAATSLLADVGRRAIELDVYRGQVITVSATPHGESKITFVERAEMDPEELILPAGVLDRIERHVVGPSRHRQALLDAGRHLGRGLLLWGPPGTGKTHTVRYLTGAVKDTTVILLSGGSLGMAGAFGTLARRLQPSLIVLEDVDLVAEDRDFDDFGSNTVLFELMNEMSGQAADADVAFILTTNRPESLEAALAARPGRVDLAVEIPLPDADARSRLIDLYGRGIDLQLDDRSQIVRRTEGVTASFLRELLRKATLTAAEHGRRTVIQADLTEALDELLHETATLTRVLLGGERPRHPSAQTFLRSFPGAVAELEMFDGD